MWAVPLLVLAAQLSRAGARPAAGEGACRADGAACAPDASEEVSALQVSGARRHGAGDGLRTDPEAELGGRGALSAYEAVWRGMRRGLSPEEEARVAAALEERYAEPPSLAQPDGAVAVPFHAQGYGTYNMYLTLQFDGAGGRPFSQTTQGDSGFNGMQMCCWANLDQSKYTALSNTSAPFGGGPAKLVRGSVSLRLAGKDAYYALENVTFWACDCDTDACRRRCSYHGIGLGLGEQFDSGVYSPLSPRGSAVPPAPHDVVRFDYANSQLLLYTDRAAAPTCSATWLGVAPVSWTALKVAELKLAGKQIKQWVSPHTVAFLDTGGEMTFLQWGVGGKPDPFPKPELDLQCPAPSWFHNTSSDPHYKDCVCRYSSEVVFSLQGWMGPRFDTTISQEAVYDLPGTPSTITPSTMPTLVTCKQANVGSQNWANLGGVFFQLNDITFDYKEQQVCIEPRAPVKTTPAPSREAGY